MIKKALDPLNLLRAGGCCCGPRRSKGGDKLKIRYKGVEADVETLSDLKTLAPDLMEEARDAILDSLIEEHRRERAELVDCLESLGFPTDGPRLSREHIVFEQVLEARRGRHE